jgi:hypothetical protein
VSLNAATKSWYCTDYVAMHNDDKRNSASADVDVGVKSRLL